MSRHVARLRMRQEHAGDDNRQYELQDAETGIGTERQQHVAAGGDPRADLVQRPAEVVRRQPPELVQRLADQRPIGKARRRRRYGEAAVGEAGGWRPPTGRPRPVYPPALSWGL